MGGEKKGRGAKKIKSPEVGPFLCLFFQFHWFPEIRSSAYRGARVPGCLLDLYSGVEKIKNQTPLSKKSLPFRGLKALSYATAI